MYYLLQFHRFCCWEINTEELQIRSIIISTHALNTKTKNMDEQREKFISEYRAKISEHMELEAK